MLQDCQDKMNYLHVSEGHDTKVKDQKAPLFDMTFIPSKYKIDMLHSQGTIGQKRKWDLHTYE